jgi:hypothetical protein
MQESKRKKNPEIILASLLLVPLIIGTTFFVHGQINSLAAGVPKSGSTPSNQSLLQGSNALQKPGNTFPTRFKVQGKVGDQYTVAQDPETGETLINDSMGSLGSNTTSIDGDRAFLANDMVALDQYSNTNQNNLSPKAFNWLKNVAKSGIQQAVGTPGLPPSAQPALSPDLLSQYYNVSENPAESTQHPDQYPDLAKLYDTTVAAGSSGSTGSTTPQAESGSSSIAEYYAVTLNSKPLSSSIASSTVSTPTYTSNTAGSTEITPTYTSNTAGSTAITPTYTSSTAGSTTSHPIYTSSTTGSTTSYPTYTSSTPSSLLSISASTGLGGSTASLSVAGVKVLSASTGSGGGSTTSTATSTGGAAGSAATTWSGSSTNCVNLSL